MDVGEQVSLTQHSTFLPICVALRLCLIAASVLRSRSSSRRQFRKMVNASQKVAFPGVIRTDDKGYTPELRRCLDMCSEVPQGDFAKHIAPRLDCVKLSAHYIPSAMEHSTNEGIPGAKADALATTDRCDFQSPFKVL